MTKRKPRKLLQPVRGTHPPLPYEGREQFQTWSVCQKCARVVLRGHPDWIDAPMLTRTGELDPRGLRVVRCPLHWSEWALRISVGRTDENRQKMAELKKKYAYLQETTQNDPFPLSEVMDKPPDRKMY